MEGRGNLGIMFLSWWYGDEVAKVWRYIKKFFLFLTDLFSAQICLKTLFSEWRRDKIDTTDLPLQQIFQAWTLNLASRIVGFVIKSATLFTYLIFLIFFVFFFLILYLSLFLMPAIIVFLMILGSKELGGI